MGAQSKIDDERSKLKVEKPHEERESALDHKFF